MKEQIKSLPPLLKESVGMLPNCTHVSCSLSAGGNTSDPVAQQETGSRFGAAAGLVAVVHDFMRFVRKSPCCCCCCRLLFMQTSLWGIVSLCVLVSHSRFVRVRVNSLVANYRESLPALTLEHQCRSVAILAKRLHIEAQTKLPNEP